MLKILNTELYNMFNNIRGKLRILCMRNSCAKITLLQSGTYYRNISADKENIENES
jgi:hypothetical protein